MKKTILIFFLVQLFLIPAVWADSPLAPLKTDTPRDTMKSFMEAMRDYKIGLISGNENSLARLDDAVRCLNLEEVPVMSRQQFGREAAILLKEVIDRIIVIDYEKIPVKAEGEESEPLTRWRLKDTEIVISKVQEGDRAGEFLFSSGTVARAQEFYDRVKHLPYQAGGGGGAGYREPWLKRHLPNWATNKLLTLEYWQWLGIFAAVLVGLTMRLLAQGLVRLIRRITVKTATSWDDRLAVELSAPVGLLAATGVWYLSLHLLRLTGLPLAILNTAIQILLFVALTWLAYRLAGVGSEFLKTRAEKTKDKLDDQLVKLLARTLKVFIVIFGVLLGAQNMGVDVFSLLAGLGIGGLAVALAAKDSLANFFGSIMIMLDRPFQVGDWVKTGSVEGTVEDIGFRSTKIRTFYDSITSVPNSEIAVSGIDNMGLRNFRRQTTTLGVTYDTPAEKIEAFLEGIKNIIKANPYTRKDYYHVVFTGFGDSSLNVLVYFFLKTPDWSEEMVATQNIYLEILRLAAAMGIDFAFPTQTLHVESFPEKTGLRAPHEVDRDQLTETARLFGSGGADSRPEGSGIFVPGHRE